MFTSCSAGQIEAELAHLRWLCLLSHSCTPLQIGTVLCKPLVLLHLLHYKKIPAVTNWLTPGLNSELFSHHCRCDDVCEVLANLFILLVFIIEPGKVRPIANDSLLCCAEQLTIDLIALQGADPAISAVHIFCQRQWMASCAKRRRFHPAALRLWRQGGLSHHEMKT